MSQPEAQEQHTPPITYIEFPETALAWHELETILYLKNMISIKIVLAPSEICNPDLLFFGNPKKQITGFNLFNNVFDESDVSFLIRVPI